jgi:alkanesulfonate monooxygenase SsuD/methylene tetrahydromethanopterin reductase-like flavin-dependent oxidoreductase (luciferase family)
MNEPRLRDDLPVMLGGGGEKKTFAMAARYAQHLNVICPPADLSRKLAALDERCGGGPRPVHPGDQRPRRPDPAQAAGIGQQLSATRAASRRPRCC